MTVIIVVGRPKSVLTRGAAQLGANVPGTSEEMFRLDTILLRLKWFRCAQGHPRNNGFALDIDNFLSILTPLAPKKLARIPNHCCTPTAPTLHKTNPTPNFS
jgi:hypothetical protein